MQPHCAQPLLNSLIAHTTPTGSIPETPELGHLSITAKMLVPNGGRYCGVPLYVAATVQSF